jgi:hypothetical protein
MLINNFKGGNKIDIKCRNYWNHEICLILNCLILEKETNSKPCLKNRNHLFLLKIKKSSLFREKINEMIGAREMGRDD